MCMLVKEGKISAQKSYFLIRHFEVNLLIILGTNDMD